MSEVKEYEPGTPSWVDLGTTDAEAARSFYGELMGWSFEVGTPETANYANAQVRGKNVAGIYELSPEMREQGVPPNWTTYIAVSDADKVSQQVQEAGGQIMMGPMDVMEYGRMAIAQDPTGAVFGLWQAGTHQGAELVNEPGGVVWNHLVTPDPSAAGAFYEALGWSLEEIDMEGSPQIMFKVGDRMVAGMGDVADYPPGTPPHWAVFFAVDDCDSRAERVPGLGGTVLVPPTDMPFGRFTTIQDPQGAVFSIVKMPEDAPSS